MTPLGALGGYKEAPGFRRTKILCLLAAGALFLASFALQLAAALQRWLVFGAGSAPGGFSVENHRFDYYLPSPEWVPLGTTAQLLGTALLIQAVGILAMAAGVLFLPDPTVDHLPGVGIAIAACEVLLAVLFAASFAAIGAHTLSSGLAGSASAPAFSADWALPVLAAGFVVPLILAAMWRIRLPGAGAACLFLAGTGAVGYLVASYLISPLLAGTAYDARWTELVMALWTAAAAAAIILGVRGLVRRTATRSP